MSKTAKGKQKSTEIGPLFGETIIKEAVDLLSNQNPGNTEDYTGRYVTLILQKMFPITDWAIVPQYLTQNNKYPDLVIERFRKKKDDSGMRFLPRVYVELKSTVGSSTESALKQVTLAASSERGQDFASSGFLIVVRGREWLFTEYNLVNSKEKIYTIPFQEKVKDFSQERADHRPQIPTPKKKSGSEDNNRFYLDIEKDTKHIHDILSWIAAKGHARQFKSPRGGLPESASVSTFGSLLGLQGKLQRATKLDPKMVKRIRLEIELNKLETLAEELRAKLASLEVAEEELSTPERHSAEGEEGDKTEKDDEDDENDEMEY